ncbi:acyl-CoA dehydrogenase family protein, partial [Thermoflexus sp.]|uniref:acyl-CoA dehydrogenase family protein n=1 Tax=Thermoflexus sp. TaxID=1969742 RepID=UPI0034577DA3
MSAERLSRAAGTFKCASGGNPMDFRLSDEHRMVQQMVREFAEREVRPVIKEHDRAQKPIPWLFERMAALGL